MRAYSDVVIHYSGVPVGGCQIYVYLAGTTTLATIYSTNGTGSPLTNPFNNNSDGTYKFYAVNGRYDIVPVRAGFTFDLPDSADILLYDPQDTIINVKDSPYRAKGDGITDDTVAIQAAYTAAGNATVAIQPSGGSLIGSIPLVVFPPGHYMISSTILPASAYSKTIGIGNPIIEQTVTTQNIFDFAGGYVVDIEGLSLVGGSSQIRFGNNNLNSSRLYMNRMEFQRNNNAPMIQFYLTGGALNLSATATLSNSKIINPYQAVQTVAGVSMRIQDTWVQAVNTGVTPPTMVDGALFVNNNEMIFDRMYGVPPATGPSTNARWVDNYGTFDAIHTRFGGEGGGMPIIYNYVGPTTVYPYVSTASAVRIRDSVVAMGPSSLANRSIIRFVTDIPQSLIIENNAFAVQDSNQYISVAGGLNLTTYINGLNANTKLYISVKNNQGWQPLHVGGYPTALVNTDPSKVRFSFDHPQALETVSYSTTPTINPGDAENFLVVPTNGNAFTITLTSNPYPSWSGQVITVTVKNTFGVLGAISHGVGFKGTSWVAPANGNSRSKTFCFDGTNWVQITETTADVPN